MGDITGSLKISFQILILEMSLFLILFFLIELIYLGRSPGDSIDNASTSLFVRIIYLQVFVQFIFMVATIYFSRNVFLIWLIMLAIFIGYYAVIGRGIPNLTKLIGFGAYGSTTPSFLIYFFSSAISVFLAKSIFGKL